MTRMVRALVITSLGALIVAALLHLLVSLGVQRVWSAQIHLLLLGWITTIILAVNYHMMPVFSGRNFPYPALITAHWASHTIGLACVTLGLLLAWPMLTSVGFGVELLASLVFVANTILLFVRGPARPQRPPMPPIADQLVTDRLGTRATKSSGICLPIALLLLLAAQQGWIGSQWVLAAEHLITLGWIMLMVVGVAYHVLPRFSGRGIRGAAWARLQLVSHQLALVLIVAALGSNWLPLFAIGGVLMSSAIGLFVWTIWPTLAGRRRKQSIQLTLPERTR